MGKIWFPGGGGGADLDVVTAGAGDVLAGKVIVGADGEPLTGTLALSGTAADSQVLSGQTYYNTDAKTKRTGSMVNRGAVSQSLGINSSYTIPAGYHNGSGKVTQSIPTRGAATITPSTANQTAISAGYYASGNVIVAGDPKLIPANIKKGVTIFGKKGTFEGFVPDTYTIYKRGTFGSGYSINDVQAILDDRPDSNPSMGSQRTATRVAEASAIKFTFNKPTDVYGNGYGYVKISKAINFTPYNTLNFTVSNIVSYYSSSQGHEWEDIDTNAYIIGTSGNQLASLMYYNGGKTGATNDVGTPTGELTRQINISGVNTTGYIVICIFAKSYGSGYYDSSINGTAYLHQLWFT